MHSLVFERTIQNQKQDGTTWTKNSSSNRELLLRLFHARNAMDYCLPNSAKSGVNCAMPTFVQITNQLELSG